MPLLPIKLERYLLRLKKLWIDWRGISGQIYFEHRVSQYKNIWQQVANEIGAQFRELSGTIWELELNGHITRVDNYILEFDNPVTLHLAGNKPLVHNLLKENGLSVPDYIVFQLNELEKAHRFLEKYPAGCVIKPADGYGGKGVTTHILERKEVRKAAILASLYSKNLMMEPQKPGECYRILVINGRMVHAVCRKGLRLTGDGENKVSDLIAFQNVSLGKEKKNPIDIDRDCLFTLGYQNLSLDAVPAKGVSFQLKSVNDPLRKQTEVRTVYNETVTDIICDSIRDQAELAAKLIRSDFVGVDIITTDPRTSLQQTGGVINEVNTTPALHHHYDSSVEPYPQAAIEAISILFKRNRSNVN